MKVEPSRQIPHKLATKLQPVLLLYPQDLKYSHDKVDVRVVVHTAL